MAMVGVDSGSLYRRPHSLSRLAWSWVGGHLAPSNKPGELPQWLCHDDSTINIVVLIIIIIIIITHTMLCAVEEYRKPSGNVREFHVVWRVVTWPVYVMALMVFMFFCCLKCVRLSVARNTCW